MFQVHGRYTGIYSFNLKIIKKHTMVKSCINVKEVKKQEPMFPRCLHKFFLFFNFFNVLILKRNFGGQLFFFIENIGH